ncbi:neuropeptide-like protein 31, partial [Pollicipes pollicipes]|uniref:neuropeptide-like protein 31 n=1 Tax=Pollicipes pollicipes TaxID=41117 RepID=UPI001884DF05
MKLCLFLAALVALSAAAEDKEADQEIQASGYSSALAGHGRNGFRRGRSFGGYDNRALGYNGNYGQSYNSRSGRGYGRSLNGYGNYGLGYNGYGGYY